jgi:hypothetical protein
MSATSRLAWIDGSCAEQMIQEADHRAPLETGGVLIGYWSAQRDAVVIKAVTGPGDNATSVGFSCSSVVS